MKNYLKSGLLALVIALGATTIASASTINATLQSVSGQSINYTFNGTSKNTTAGRFNWNRVPENPATPALEAGSFPLDPIPSGDLFYSFCIDLSQTVSIGGTYEWEVEEDLADGRNSPAPYGAIGSTIAGNLAKLIAAVLPGGSIAANMTTIEAAALQVVIWEMIYDSGSFDLGQGSFKFNSGTSGVLSTATNFYNTYSAYQGAGASGLMALNNSNRQDQMIQILGDPDTQVPEPGTYALLGMGLLAIGLFRRKMVR